MTPQQIEHNLKYDFSLTGEDGKAFEPVFGPGLTGLCNLGNRWDRLERRCLKTLTGVYISAATWLPLSKPYSLFLFSRKLTIHPLPNTGENVPSHYLPIA